MIHLYPQLNFKSCPSRTDSAKRKHHPSLSFTASVFKSREKTEYPSLFSDPQRSWKWISHAGDAQDSVKGDSIAVSSKLSHAGQENSCDMIIFDVKVWLWFPELNITWQTLFLPERKLQHSHLPDATSFSAKADCDVFPNLAAGLHSSNFLGFWEVDIYFTGPLSWRDEIFFCPFLTSKRFFPAYGNNYSISRPLLYLFFSLSIGKAETLIVERGQRGNQSPRVRVAHLSPHRCLLRLFLLRLILSNFMQDISLPRFSHLPQDPLGCPQKSQTGQLVLCTLASILLKICSLNWFHNSQTFWMFFVFPATLSFNQIPFRGLRILSKTKKV